MNVILRKLDELFKTSVKAKKPGTSRKLCKIPISFPVNSAASLLKLLISAIHVENTSGITKAINNRKTNGVRHCVGNFIDMPLKRR